MKQLLILLFISNSSIAHGVEVPEELAPGLVQYFDGWLCKDSLFTTCVGISQFSCTEHLPAVLNGCDYGPVWDEIEQNNRSNSIEESGESASLEYGACVNSRFIERFSIERSVFDECIIENRDRYIIRLEQKE